MDTPYCLDCDPEFELRQENQRLQAEVRQLREQLQLDRERHQKTYSYMLHLRNRLQAYEDVETTGAGTDGCHG